MPDLWPALIRYNPRVLAPPADGWAEWREAAAEPGPAERAQVEPVALKFAGLDAPDARRAADAARSAGVVLREGRQGAERPVLVVGSRAAVAAFVSALAEAGATDLAAALAATIAAAARTEFRLRLPKGDLTSRARPLIMGVVNVTPDSFSDGGRFFEREAAVAQGLALTKAGADLVDVGGESTRPGAPPVEAAAELERVLPVVEALARDGCAPISVDTSKAAVAEACVRAGAALVNDVTALAGDEKMAATVAALGVPVCLMHMQGTPRTMQHRPAYDDLMGEITLHLRRAIARGVAAGLDEEQVLVDPGIGFGKTVSHNLGVLNRLGQLRSLGRPIVVGTSRKSFVGKALSEAGVQRPVGERLFGTAGTVAAAVMNGAHVLRVHDVTEMRDVVRMVSAIRDGSSEG